MEPERRRVFWFGRIFGFTLTAIVLGLAVWTMRENATLWGAPVTPAFSLMQGILLIFVALFFAFQTLRNT